MSAVAVKSAVVFMLQWALAVRAVYSVYALNANALGAVAVDSIAMGAVVLGAVAANCVVGRAGAAWVRRWCGDGWHVL